MSRGDEISKEVLIELRKNNGFIPNPSRGTGYLFRLISQCAVLYVTHLCNIKKYLIQHVHTYILYMGTACPKY